MEFDVIESVEVLNTTDVEDGGNPLTKYSLRGSHAELSAKKLDEVHVLPGIALLGHATVLYAAPNTGKTLISLAILGDAIQSKRISAEKVYYVNMDDSFNGHVDKCAFAEKNNFHYLAQGQKDFDVERLRVAMARMIEEDTAMGCVVILDTLKKFADLMDKTKSSKFASLVRKFVSKGGTVIAFAHTNKNLGADGKRQYGGTSDIMDDFDCGYIMEEISLEDKNGTKLVEFRNIKARGPVDAYAYYKYLSGSDVSYADKLASVKMVPLSELETTKAKAQMSRDADAIEVVCSQIREGISQRMKLVKAINMNIGLSRQAALAVLDRYTGQDKESHVWTVKTVARGAKLYSLLQDAEALHVEDEY